MTQIRVNVSITIDAEEWLGEHWREDHADDDGNVEDSILDTLMEDYGAGIVLEEQATMTIEILADREPKEE